MKSGVGMEIPNSNKFIGDAVGTWATWVPGPPQLVTVRTWLLF